MSTTVTRRKLMTIPEPELVGEVGRCSGYCADASLLLAYLGDHEPNLVFMDPPFNNGTAYDDWDDNLDRGDFFECLFKWMSTAAAVMADTGSLWVHVPDDWAADVVVIGRDNLDLHLENWIVQHYRFGQHRPNRFISSKCHGLWFSHGNPKVNPDAALVPSDRAAIYNDDRVLDAERMGRRMDLDVWGFERYWGRVQGNNKERRSLHQNQLPELYLKRIIEVLTDPGDLVVDPFCGSGTTATVAEALNRTSITGDITRRYVESALGRVEEGAVRV
jgi:site-specific DNA-methyltransferase (adenine-specific)